MRLLIDTHNSDPGTRSHWLGARAKDLLLDAEHEHGVSAARVWEIAIKACIGKLRLIAPLA